MTARRFAFIKMSGFLAGLALATAASAADGVPRAFAFDRLSDNGRSFITSEGSLSLRCLDVPGLLALPVPSQDQTLDRAVGAGFNAISFEAPLFGEQGLAKSLGTVDAAQGEALGRLLQSMARHRLYAFPVLWTPATADALIGTSNAKVAFFNGKNSLGWQAWAAKQLAALKVDGEAMTATSAVGGWLLYRGPWPGGEPKHGAVLETVTPTTEAWMRNWAQWQVRVFRKAGFSQRLGLGLWAKQDLARAADDKISVPAPSLDAEHTDAPPSSDSLPVAGGAPFAPLATDEQDATGDTAQAAALDVLPAVPGAGGVSIDEDGNAVEDASDKVDASATPWDLEGLDWDRIEEFFATAPLSTQVDFLEFSLGSEDWYRVGDRLAEAALKAEVPVIWRQDWRTASRYERGKRLEPPAPLAGLQGPWPEDDWPGDGESIWPAKEHAAPAVPFKFGSVELKRKGSQVQLLAELNKPAGLIVRWGKAWPLNKEERSKGRPKTAHVLHLAGVAPGQWVLVQVKAQSANSGSAVARARWMQAPK